VGLADAEGEAEGLSDAEGDVEAEGLAEGDSDADGLVEAEGAIEGLAVIAGEEVIVGLAVAAAAGLVVADAPGTGGVWVFGLQPMAMAAAARVRTPATIFLFMCFLPPEAAFGRTPGRLIDLSYNRSIKICKG
jgi:hypothetical protein